MILEASCKLLKGAEIVDNLATGIGKNADIDRIG
jgi:hypothetical protein